MSKISASHILVDQEFEIKDLEKKSTQARALKNSLKIFPSVHLVNQAEL